MGFVVRDIDKAMRHWVEVCGVGPWYIAEKLPLHGFWYKEQRWSSWPENYHELLDRAVNGGWTVGQRGESPRGPFVYFLNEGHPGTVIEMAELTPTRRHIFDAVREAAVHWDGRDPIRHDWPHA
jgi:hypothetical protein